MKLGGTTAVAGVNPQLTRMKVPVREGRLTGSTLAFDAASPTGCQPEGRENREISGSLPGAPSPDIIPSRFITPGKL